MKLHIQAARRRIPAARSRRALPASVVVAISAAALAVPALSAPVTCAPVEAYVARLKGATATGPDGKICAQLVHPRVVISFCDGAAPGSRAVSVAGAPGTAPLEISATSVLEWNADETGVDTQGFASLRSGLVLAGSADAVSILYTDFLSDDPNVASGRPPPADRVSLVKAATGSFTCDKIKGRSDGTLMDEIARLHAAPATGQGAR